MVETGPSTEDAFGQLWQQAFDAYEVESGRNLTKEAALLLHLPTVDALEAHVQQKVQSNTEARNKHRVWAVLRASVGPLENLTALGKTVVSIGISGCAPAAVVFGAVSFLLDAAKGVTETYDNIADLLTRLEYFTGRFIEYLKGDIDEKLQRIAVKILTTLLLIFARSEKLIRDGTTTQRLKTFARTALLGKDSKVKGYIDRLRELVDVETKMATSIVLSTTQQMNQRTKRIEESTERLQASMSSLSDSKEIDLVKDTLDPTAFVKVAGYQAKFSEKRLYGTCEWIKDASLYKSWLDGAFSVLWVLGGPGAGKSCLSSGIVSNLRKLYPEGHDQASSTSLGYFYIREDDHQLQSVSTILKSLAFQLARNNIVYQKYLATRVCNSLEKISTESGLWRHLFMNFFASQNYLDHSTFLVIDGLDEASRDSRESLIRFIGEIETDASGGNRPRISVALVGRPELEDLASLIWGRRIRYISMSSMNNTEDIKRYIMDGLGKVQILKNAQMKATPKLRMALKRKIRHKLLENANGMFLWVSLMIDQISPMSRPELIYDALESAPPELESMIRHIFERLAQDPSVYDSIDDLNEILAWVSYARRPLHLGEMYLLLRLRSPTGEAMYLLEEKLKGPFASFFTLTDDQDIFEEIDEDLDVEAASDTVHEEDPLEEPDSQWGSEDEDFDEEDQSASALAFTLIEKLEASSSADRLLPVRFKTTVIQFSHASIRDFLLKEGTSEKRQSTSRLRIGFEASKAELNITQTCLSLLSESEGVRRGSFEASMMANYAAEYFMSHLVALDKSVLDGMEKRSVLKTLCFVFYSKDGMSSWLENIRDRDQFFNNWFGNRQFVDCVCEWFGDEIASETNFNVDEREYMAVAKHSIKGLFRPMAKMCASKWLGNVDVDADPSFYIWFLHIYSRFIDCDSWTAIHYQPQVDRIEISKISLDQLYSLANSFEVEQPSCWHGRLASVMRDVGYLDAAIEEFQRALAMENSRIWLIGLAQSYAKLGKYPIAIDWGHQALATLTNDDRSSQLHRAEILRQISTWHLQINETEKAIDAAQEAFPLDRENLQILGALIKALYVGKYFGRMVDLQEKYFQNFPLASQTSVLQQLSKFGFTRMIAIASVAVNRRESIEKLLRNAVAGAEDTKNEFQLEQYRYYLGVHLMTPSTPSRTAEAISLLEQVFESVKDRKYTSARRHLRNETHERLSQLYFRKAEELEQSADNDSNEWISKLEVLSGTIVSLSRGLKSYYPNAASLMLGLWYSKHQNRKQAKAYLQGIVLQAIDLLRDSDPTNDIAGYQILAQAFLFFQDEVNAIGAFSLVNAPLERLKKAKALAQHQQELAQSQSTGLPRTQSINRDPDDVSLSSDALSSKFSIQSPKSQTIDTRLPRRPSNRPGATSFPTAESLDQQIKTWTPSMFWECRGSCNQDATLWKSAHFCTQCIRRVYCDGCLKKFKQGMVPLVAPCHIEHTFFQAFPLKDKIEDVEFVTIAEETMGRIEWLAKLRREWMDEDFVPPATKVS